MNIYLSLIPLLILLPLLMVSCIYIFLTFQHPKDKYPLKTLPLLSIFNSHLLPLLIPLTLPFNAPSLLFEILLILHLVFFTINLSIMLYYESKNLIMTLIPIITMGIIIGIVIILADW
jgi:hypothetical protein